MVAKDFEKALKDLQHLEKSCVMKQEMEALKSKMKKLEQENGTLKADLESMQALKKENLKLKADLVAKEENRLLYNNAFDQKVKEMTELNAENEALKAKILSLEGSSDPLIRDIEQEDRPIQELTSSSIESALSVNDTGSDEETTAKISEAAPLLAICDRHDKTRPNVAPLKNIFQSTREQAWVSASVAGRNEKQPWKCIVCKSRYDTIEELRSHIGTDHSPRKHFCARCPFTTASYQQLKNHEGQHRDNELKCSDSGNFNKCGLCNIYFFRLNAFTGHIKMYH